MFILLPDCYPAGAHPAAAGHRVLTRPVGHAQVQWAMHKFKRFGGNYAKAMACL
jgi:hypothetical protein